MDNRGTDACLSPPTHLRIAGTKIKYTRNSMVFCPELMFVVCSLHLFFYKVYAKQSDEFACR